MLREDGTGGCSIGESNVDSDPCLAGSGQHHLKLAEILEECLYAFKVYTRDYSGS